MYGVQYNSILDIQFNDDAIVEPVTLSEAKDFCKIDISNDDVLIESIITAARQMCEAYTGVGFVVHEITAILNNMNGDIYLPYGPLYEIVEVTNENDVVLEAGTGYKLRGNDFVRLEWPAENNITIEYFAGYGELPEVLRLGLLNAIYYLYDNRSIEVDEIGPIAKMILKPFRRV
jgi:uncharacterized phiE125 gp8 family phage protein